MPTLEVNGLTVHFSELGIGEEVVLVHGGNTSGRFWHNLSSALKDAYRLLAIDLYGCGGTDPWPATGYPSHDEEAELVRALIDSLRGPVHLVGHSYGAAVCLRAALTHRARLHSLTLVEPTAYLLLEQARQRLRETTELMIGGFRANSNNPTRLAECRQLGLPTLLIRGEKTVLPEAHMSEILARNIPGARLEVIRAAGHMSPQTHPAEVGAAIKAHLLNSRDRQGN